MDTLPLEPGGSPPGKHEQSTPGSQPNGQLATSNKSHGSNFGYEAQEVATMAHAGTIIHATMRDLNNHFPGACWGSKQRVKDWLKRKDQK